MAASLCPLTPEQTELVNGCWAKISTLLDGVLSRHAARQSAYADQPGIWYYTIGEYTAASNALFNLASSAGLQTKGPLAIAALPGASGSSNAPMGMEHFAPHLYQRLRIYLQDRLLQHVQQVKTQHPDPLSMLAELWQRFFICITIACRAMQRAGESSGVHGQAIILQSSYGNAFSSSGVSSVASATANNGAKKSSGPATYNAAVYFIGLQEFKQAVFDSVGKDACGAFLLAYQNDRLGQPADRASLISIREVAIELGRIGDQSNREGVPEETADQNLRMRVYRQAISDPLIVASTAYYSDVSKRLIADLVVPEYLERCERLVSDEDLRASSILDPSSYGSVLKVVREALFKDHLDSLLAETRMGFRFLLANASERSTDLGRIYRMLKTVQSGAERMADVFREYIVSDGESLKATLLTPPAPPAAGATTATPGEKPAEKAPSEKPKRPVSHGDEYMKALLDRHDRLASMVKNQFEGTDVFWAAFRRAFETLMGQDMGGQSAAELIATLCDALLREKYKDIDETGKERFLEQAVVAYAYLPAKDLFVSYYQNMLAKRLLAGAVSTDAESSMLAKIKEKHGATVTSRMEGMLNDRMLSNELNQSFSLWLKERPAPLLGFDFACSVLRLGCWPVFDASEIIPPAEVVDAMSVFEDYYKKRDPQRQRVVLRLVMTAGTVQMKLKAAMDYEVTMTPEQASLVLLFNKTASMTAEQIANTLFKPDGTDASAGQIEMVKKNLAAMSISEFKIFVKRDDGTYAFNESFVCKARRFTVPAVRAKTAKEEKEQISANLREDRKYKVDAAIVRVMKAKRRMRIQELMTETIKQCAAHFTPEPRMIKACIESLIDREFLERDASDKDFMLYRA